MLVLVLASFLSCRVGVLFRAGISLLAYCTLSLELWSIALLAGMFSPTLGAVYKREKLSHLLISTCSFQDSFLL